MRAATHLSIFKNKHAENKSEWKTGEEGKARCVPGVHGGGFHWLTGVAEPARYVVYALPHLVLCAGRFCCEFLVLPFSVGGNRDFPALFTLEST